MRLIRQSQLARKMKLSRARISQLVKEGKLKLVNGKVDACEAEEFIRGRMDRRRSNLKSGFERLYINTDEDSLRVLQTILDELATGPMERMILVEKVKAKFPEKLVNKILDRAIAGRFITVDWTMAEGRLSDPGGTGEGGHLRHLRQTG